MTRIEGLGTTEADWRAWEPLWSHPALQLPAGRVVVVAPHPDDEVLALGGLLQAHDDCAVVPVTDGEASHPGSQILTPRQLAEARGDELVEALRRLNRTDIAVLRLGHPDGAVDEDLLAGQLTTMLRPGDVCAATWRHDGHPDHEAVGRAAARAARDTQAQLWEYPVWMWHWASPRDPRVPWDRLRALHLDEEAGAAKQLAIAAFRTQVEPLSQAPEDAAILPPEVRARFDRPQEFVFIGDLPAEPRP